MLKQNQMFLWQGVQNLNLILAVRFRLCTYYLICFSVIYTRTSVCKIPDTELKDHYLAAII